MVTKKRLKSGTLGEGHGLEDGPAAQEVTAEHGSFLFKPAQDMRDVGLEGPGQAVRETHLRTTEAAAGLDELRQRAHLWALRLERLQRVAMCEQELEWEGGVRGSILRAAGGESLAVPGEGERMDGEQDEARVLAQRGNTGPLMELQAYGDGVTAEALA